MNGLESTLADFAATAAKLDSGDRRDLVPESELPFYDYLLNAAAKYDAAVQNEVISDDTVAPALTSQALELSDQSTPNLIQQFKVDAMVEHADFVTLVKEDKQAEVTLGMLDAKA